MRRVELPVRGAVSFRLPRIDAAQVVTPVAADLSVAPGLEEAGAWAWHAGDAERVDLVCAAGPAFTWVSGFERPILDAASALVRRLASLPTLTVAEVEGGPPFSQRYRGEALIGRHWLGFTEGELVVCSLACRGEGSACADWLEGAGLTGSEATVPAPGPVLQIAVEAAERPRLTIVSSVIVSLLVAAVILWRRPR